MDQETPICVPSTPSNRIFESDYWCKYQNIRNKEQICNKKPSGQPNSSTILAKFKFILFVILSIYFDQIYCCLDSNSGSDHSKHPVRARRSSTPLRIVRLHNGKHLCVPALFHQFHSHIRYLRHSLKGKLANAKPPWRWRFKVIFSCSLLEFAMISIVVYCAVKLEIQLIDQKRIAHAFPCRVARSAKRIKGRCLLPLEQHQSTMVHKFGILCKMPKISIINVMSPYFYSKGSECSEGINQATTQMQDSRWVHQIWRASELCETHDYPLSSLHCPSSRHPFPPSRSKLNKWHGWSVVTSDSQ